MPHGTVSTIIPAPASAVFALLHDYDRRLEWDTLLSAAYLTDGHEAAGLGATSVCVGRGMLGRIAMPTVYVAFDPPRLAAVKLIGNPPWFASWAASIRHEDLDSESSAESPGSRITYTWTFAARPRLLAPLLEPIMQWLFERETRRRLAALAQHFARQPSRQLVAGGANHSAAAQASR
jgi:hypothetical protein